MPLGAFEAPSRLGNTLETPSLEPLRSTRPLAINETEALSLGNNETGLRDDLAPACQCQMQRMISWFYTVKTKVERNTVYGYAIKWIYFCPAAAAAATAAMVGSAPAWSVGCFVGGKRRAANFKRTSRVRVYALDLLVAGNECSPPVLTDGESPTAREPIFTGVPDCASDATGQMPMTSLLTLALSQNSPPVSAPEYVILIWMPLRSDVLTEPFSGTYAKRVDPPSPSLSLSIAPGQRRLTLSRSSDHAASIVPRPPADMSPTASTAAFALDAMREIFALKSLTALAVTVIVGADISEVLA